MISCSDQAALLVVGDWAVRCDNRNNTVVAKPLSGIGKTTTSGRWDWWKQLFEGYFSDVR